ncbi:MULTISPECIES: peptidoglycan-associated lipoprotein Pal [Thioalkalivibrio]|uniref:Peptidoglycan-associated lipoprotein n=1 Tax=Thioalkalivibrio versutus TaxID=106634 RepID=A0A0G3G8A0_9GAMM|nr:MULTISPECIES: peptidoglycan-associated lipoprotein Pal [Thioalkalivibrio]AKJ95737.1 lipoprotein [Thioalkalivibrio versutus]OOC48993.1 peptidoglycan-associated lipoprotein [Thioalkalivibrio versutus]
MNNLFRLALAAVVIAALSACATPTRDAEDAERAAEREAAAEQARAEREAAEARGLGRDRDFDAAALDDPESPLAERLVYFEFDRDEVKSEYMPMLEAHAAYLSQNSGARLRLEGHTDERGTREYNLALGERRAQSVRRVLNLNGASDDQLEVISYGEEMPVAFQQNEEAWAKNRRVELVYESRR